MDWVKSIAELTEGQQVVAVDGKTLRGCHDRAPRSSSPASGERLGVAEPPGAGSDAHVSPLQRDHGDPPSCFHS